MALPSLSNSNKNREGILRLGFGERGGLKWHCLQLVISTTTANEARLEFVGDGGLKWFRLHLATARRKES